MSEVVKYDLEQCREEIHKGMIESMKVLDGSPGSSVAALAVRLGDFTADQIADLYDQHTQATGQAFTKDAVDRVIELSQGQPGLVNALADHITFAMGASGIITTAHVDEAKERLIRKHPVHLDAIMTRLHEPRDLLRHWFLSADLLNREQYGPFTDEEPTEAYLRIFGSSHQKSGRM
ncbi:hypothetical protein [Nonomuraea fuscirosea]|uniref:hypothetical protein n=1 Tax=Nonomuraea fuscirosea TaxID=1291556 RepID=UPI003444F5A3